ncbi:MULTISPECIES: c-type cytochrome [unclassified Agarivorans]|uniref:c-type cytochrome n=1 Tax=unclassified Agarivorans TaxID=2636026 RepID=UPI003D7D01AC
MNKLIFSMALILSFVVSTANAAPAKAMICAACHGADGKAVIPGYPNLAGQNEQYLISSLNAYKAKQRNGGQAAIMQAQAALLNDAEIAELAAYFSKM